MISFVVFAIKCVICYITSRPNEHWTSWPRVSTRQLDSKNYKLAFKKRCEAINVLFLGHQVVLLGRPWATGHPHEPPLLQGEHRARALGHVWVILY